MSIKAVVFDYGGVISFPPSSEAESELAKLTGLPVEILRELNRKYRDEWDRGACTGIKYYKDILSHKGVFLDDDSLAQIVQTDIDGWKQVNPATLQLMRDLKLARLSIGILSNMPHEFYSWAKDSLSIFSEVNITVASCEYNIIKPEMGIFEKLKEKSCCEYAEIVLFDDTGINIEKANELGIQGFLWEGPESARRHLLNLGQVLRSI